MNTDNHDSSKEYKRGSKNSINKTTKTFKISNSHLDFMQLFIQFKHELGFHKLAYTRTDLIEEAIKKFAEEKKEEINANASQELKIEFLKNNLISSLNK